MKMLFEFGTLSINIVFSFVMLMKFRLDPISLSHDTIFLILVSSLLGWVCAMLTLIRFYI